MHCLVRGDYSLSALLLMCERVSMVGWLVD